MTIEITRTFEVPAAHRLLRHEGKTCCYAHGHNYLVSVTLQGDGIDSVGRVMDFSQVKQLIGGWLDENWDHCTLGNKLDEELCAAIEEYPNLFGRIYLFDDNPTAETMAQHLYLVVEKLLANSNLKVPCHVSKVRVQETSTCWAEYSEP